MYLNISSIDLGIIPLYGSFELYLNPSIVNVLPVPVYPYANIVALYPSRTDITACFAVVSYTYAYELSGPYT
jgi:hypothetical protein